MLSPKRSEFEARTNDTYEALIWVLARPGFIKPLPEPGFACIIETLVDRECSVHADEPDTVQLAERAGAQLTSVEEADHVFISSLKTADMLKQLAVGSDLHPDNGATLVVASNFGSGLPLRLSGPGVDNELEIRVGQLPEDIWATREACSRYPMGFDMFLVDGRQVLGLPRSTKVEVL